MGMKPFYPGQSDWRGSWDLSDFPKFLLPEVKLILVSMGLEV